MLTDIFACRYENIPLWKNVDEKTRRLLVQSFRIVGEQLFPYYQENGKENPGAKELWDGLNKQIAMELGLNDLSPIVFSYSTTLNSKTTNHTTFYPKITVCENFVCMSFDGSISADRFVKERLSFIEIAFRKKEGQIIPPNLSLKQESAERKHWSKIIIADSIQTFRAACDELNARFRQAGVNLNYHNGLIQISSDETVADEVERPFWRLVSETKWKNVDHDMKEAIDLRDNEGRDPAWYAAKALESTIKIVSDEKGFTRGNEKGPINYVENLGAKKNANFIEEWERENLVNFFSNVRRPFGHGPGNDQMPALTVAQTDWAIEFCMIWIKNLIGRM